jgi:gluconolactonase
MRKITCVLLASFIFNFSPAQQKTFGKVVSLDPAFDQLIDVNSKIEILADSFYWSEGPVWVKTGRYLLFSDIPRNTIFKWKEGEGLSKFLEPSGYTGILPYSHEPGSNGLIINNKGQLVSCDQGDRRISAMPFAHGGKRTLADNYQGKRFNSPNDIVQRSTGDYYFTDPAYGLPNHENDSTKETDFMGVYRISPDGMVSLLIDNLTPNGIAFSPDEKILYVGQSDPKKAIIMAYPVIADGSLGEGRLFFDATPMINQGLKGAPDGMKVDAKGNIFSTGGGGLLIISPAGKLLGRLEIPQSTSNCAWGDDGSTLYITANMFLCRIKTKTLGNGF